LVSQTPNAADRRAKICTVAEMPGLAGTTQWGSAGAWRRCDMPWIREREDQWHRFQRGACVWVGVHHTLGLKRKSGLAEAHRLRLRQARRESLRAADDGFRKDSNNAVSNRFKICSRPHSGGTDIRGSRPQDRSPFTGDRTTRAVALRISRLAVPDTARFWFQFKNCFDFDGNVSRQ